MQRYKAPPAYKTEPVAEGTTSKSSAPKAPPPSFPGGEEHEAQSAAQPARVPAGLLASQTAPSSAAATQETAKKEPAVQVPPAVVTPAPQQLAAVAEAAKVLAAHGFTLTEEQEEAVQTQAAAVATSDAAPSKQWAGYRPGAVQAGAGARSGGNSASSWQRTEWAQTPDETGYGQASEYHPYHQQYQEGRRGWQRQSRTWQHAPSDEGNKSRPGGPDRRERGDQRRQERQETRYSMRDLFVDTNPEE
eukprot:950376-Amphidinium_carterae.1